LTEQAMKKLLVTISRVMTVPAGGTAAPRPVVEGVGKMRAGDEIDDEQHEELDELAGDADPDALVARNASRPL
jgi:hypothetical protein